MAPPLATRSREQRNADRRPRRARLGTRSLAPQIGNDLLEIGELAVRRRTHLGTSSGPTFLADHTAIDASDHVLPVRRISPACRMSAKDLTRQAHRRFAKVRSRRNSATLAGRSTNVEDCPKRDLSGQGVNIVRLLFALTQARGEDGTHPYRLQLNQASRSLQTHLRPCEQNRS